MIESDQMVPSCMVLTWEPICTQGLPLDYITHGRIRKAWWPGYQLERVPLDMVVDGRVRAVANICTLNDWAIVRPHNNENGLK